MYYLRNYLATHMRPNNARRVFPCMDEPEFKTPFTVSIARPKTHFTLFNTELERTTEMYTFYKEHFNYCIPIQIFSTV